MKKLIAWSLLILGATVLTGCDVGINTDGLSIGGNSNSIIRGTGNLVETDFDIDAYTEVKIDGAFQVIWRESDEFLVTVETSENLLEHLEIQVDNGVLLITSRRGIGINWGESRIYLFSPSLEALNVQGAVTAKNWDTIRSERFAIEVAGAASVDLDLEVDVVEVNVAGAGDLSLLGSIQTADISIAGAGNIDIDVIGSLSVEIAGTGSVTYGGNPTVTRTILGIGTVGQR